MVGLVNLLGVERATETKGHTLAEEDVVGNSGDTAVVDLELLEGKVSKSELVGTG